MKEYEKRAYSEIVRVKALIEEQERLEKLVAPYRHPLVLQLAQDPLARHLANSAPTATQIIEEHTAKDLASLHRTVSDIEAVRALASAQEQYRLPTWDTALERELKRMVAEDQLLSAAAPKSWLDAMKLAVQQRQQPWFNESDAAGSIRAMAEIQVLGAAINAANPFSDAVTEATRKVLGDWSMVKSLPTEIFTDAAARRDFYLAHGYDAALSMVPGAARTEGRYVSGLIDIPPVPVPTKSDSESEAVEEEPDGYALAEKARTMLVDLERELRAFIGPKMTAKFGVKWTKQQVPAGVASGMKERRQEDKRRTGAEHPLIEYLDFSDYAPIITRTDNWTQVFEPYFLRASSVQESFLRMTPTRNAVMHSRPLTQDDMDFLYLEVRRLQLAMRKVIPPATEDDDDD